MFRAKETWRHRSTTEIDLFFVKIQYIGPTYIKAKVLYLNRQATDKKNILISNKAEVVKIKRSDFYKWFMIR